MTIENDEFLFLRRQPPRPVFARTLKQRLNSLSSKPSGTQHLLKYGAVVGMALTLLLLASPGVRAQIAQGIQRLFFGDVELRVIDHDICCGTGISVPVDHVSPVEAQTVYAHKTPTWLPDGFALDSAGVSVIRYNDKDIYMGYRWLSGDQLIALAVLNRANPQMVIGQGGNVRKIEINGQIGALYAGTWDDGVWNPTGGYLNLVWVDGNFTYLLSSADVSESDLLKIAESLH